MSNKTQAVAATPAQNKLAAQAKATTMDLLKGDAFRDRIVNALPKHLTPDRMIAVALTCINKTPKLAHCDQGSFFQAMLNLSQLGLEPDGRRAHLIPYGDQVQLIIDYKGLVELAMRSGQVSNIHADVVCDADVFEYDMGDIKTHKIDFKKERGEMYAAYSICTFKDGTRKCEVMSKSEVEKIRSRSRAGKAGPWVTDFNEMAKKSAFRRLSKWLPLSPEVRDAFDKDDDVPRDITASVRVSSPLARVELPDAGGETKEAAPTEPDAPFAVDTPDAAPTTPDAPAEDDDDIPY